MKIILAQRPSLKFLVQQRIFMIFPYLSFVPIFSVLSMSGYASLHPYSTDIAAIAMIEPTVTPHKRQYKRCLHTPLGRNRDNSRQREFLNVCSKP